LSDDVKENEMSGAWEKWEMCTKVWPENLKERDHSDNKRMGL
jgi:hypothetical protein